MKLALYDLKGSEKSSIELDEKVSAFKSNDIAIRETVLMNLANKRQGSASTKTKAEVAYSGIKLWKQKGTGRARAHYRSAAHLKGGGVVFGPKQRDYSFTVPKKVKQLALKSAFVNALTDDNVIVVDKIEIAEAKTKQLAEIFKNLKLDKKVLVVTAEENENLKMAVRNIKGSDYTTSKRVGTFDIVSHAKVLIEKAALEDLQQRY